MSSSNLCAKKVTPEEAYEVWQSPNGQTIHWILKKYKGEQAELADPFARWYVATTSPGTFGSYEYGDTYALTIRNTCIKMDNPLCHYLCCRLDNETTFTLNRLEKYRYVFMRSQDPMLVNYVRLAVPRTKLALFKQIAQAHTLVIVCMDANDEVHQCRNDLDNERIRLDQLGRQQYADQQAKLHKQED